MSIKEIAKGRSDIYRIAPADLHVKEGWNVRDYDQDDIDELSLSIEEVGVKQPLTVILENEKLFITDGHRRYYATLKAIERGVPIDTVPVQTEQRHSSEADHIGSMLVRNSGKPLTPLEQARVFKRLIDYGKTETEIARMAGKSRVWIVQMLELNAAPESVKKLVKDGTVSATLATQHTPAEIEQAVVKAKSEGKAKATAKHVEKGPSSKEQLKTLFDALTFTADEGSGNYGVWFTPDQYAAFRSLAGG